MWWPADQPIQKKSRPDLNLCGSCCRGLCRDSPAAVRLARVGCRDPGTTPEKTDRVVQVVVVVVEDIGRDGWLLPN